MEEAPYLEACHTVPKYYRLSRLISPLSSMLFCGHGRTWPTERASLAIEAATAFLSHPLAVERNDPSRLIVPARA